MKNATKLIILATFSALTQTGCSTIWSEVGKFSNFMAKETSFLSLRSLKSDREKPIEYATSYDPDLMQTEVGYYTPSNPYSLESGQGMASVDTSDHPCPDGSYLTEENSCMLFETGTLDEFSAELYNPEPVLDTVTNGTGCPDGTYLTEDNSCMFFETEHFSDLSDQFYEPEINFDMANTGPTCPDGTYLTAENSCMFYETTNTTP